MWYLLVAILCSVSVSVFLKLARRHQIVIQQAIMMNYLVALVLSYTMFHERLNEGLLFMIVEQRNMALTVLLLGLLLPSIFFVMSQSVQWNGIVRSDVVQRLSLIVSVVSAVMIFGEQLSVIKGVGVLLAFVSMICLLNIHRFKRPYGLQGAVLLVGVFFGYGLIDVLFKYLATLQVELSVVLFLVFFIANLCMLFYLTLTGEIWNLSLKSLGSGVLLGILNFFNIFFYLKAHQSFALSPTTVFVGMNMGVIVLSVVWGVYFFKEQVSKINQLGLLFSILSIVCLFYF